MEGEDFLQEDAAALASLEERVARLEANHARLRQFLMILAEALRNEEHDSRRQSPPSP